MVEDLQNCGHVSGLNTLKESSGSKEGLTCIYQSPRKVSAVDSSRQGKRQTI